MIINRTRGNLLRIAIGISALVLLVSSAGVAAADTETMYVPFSWSFTTTGTSLGGAYVDNTGPPGTSMSDSKTLSGSFTIKINFVPPGGDWVLAPGETIPTSTTFKINAGFSGALSDSTLGFDYHGIPFSTFAEARAGVTALDIPAFNTVHIGAASTADINQNRVSSPTSVTDGQVIPFSGYVEVETLFGFGSGTLGDFVTGSGNIEVSGSIDAQNRQIKYIKPKLTTILVSPSSATLNIAGTHAFNATALNGSTPMAGVNVFWNVSNATVGNVSASSGITDVNGNVTITFTALDAGTTFVNATNGSISNISSVTVNAVPPVLTTILVSPYFATLNITGTHAFNATALNGSTPMAGVNVSWNVSNATVGNVSASSGITDVNGNVTITFTALAAGTTFVNATNGSISNISSVTVM
ncbi:MAG: Ig-like domain-containing protein [Candidatus Methanoperedens sp.]|nr:Ig-like domain-containing protein [Candidatus Methanoperedens sp.]